jgi:hypothetical protein
MPNLPLHIGENLARIGLIPAPIEILCGKSELNDEIAREVLRLGFGSLLSPKLDKSGFIIAHNYSGVGTADEVTSIGDPDPTRARGLLLWVRCVI